MTSRERERIASATDAALAAPGGGTPDDHLPTLRRRLQLMSWNFVDLQNMRAFNVTCLGWAAHKNECRF